MVHWISAVLLTALTIRPMLLKGWENLRSVFGRKEVREGGFGS
jgi:hypothetical protein